MKTMWCDIGPLAARFVTIAGLACACGAAQAQGYPARAVTLVLPYPPGGGFDTITRAVGQQLSERLAQPVVVENRPGANSIIGTEHAVKAAPDGYTLLVSDDSLINNSFLYRKLSYDPNRDLVPVTGLVTQDFVLAVHPSVAANSTAELIEMAKAKPGQLSYASFGQGSQVHLAMERLQAMAGIRLNHIPYKGGAPAMADVAAGHVQMMIVSLSTVTPYVKAGKLKVLAMTGLKRSPRYADLPTVAEARLPGFEVSSWYGLHAPTGTLRPVVERINADVQKVLADPAFRAKVLEPRGMEALTGTPEQFGAYIKSKAQVWSQVIRDAGVKLD